MRTDFDTARKVFKQLDYFVGLRGWPFSKVVDLRDCIRHPPCVEVMPGLHLVHRQISDADMYTVSLTLSPDDAVLLFEWAKLEGSY